MTLCNFLLIFFLCVCVWVCVCMCGCVCFFHERLRATKNVNVHFRIICTGMRCVVSGAMWQVFKPFGPPKVKYMSREKTNEESVHKHLA